MSNRELCISLINDIEEDRLVSVASVLQNIKDIIDESLDDAYCLQLYQNYLDDPDPNKSDGILFEDFARELEVELT
jgi:hypothetical protein